MTPRIPAGALVSLRLDPQRVGLVIRHDETYNRLQKLGAASELVGDRFAERYWVLWPEGLHWVWSQEIRDLGL